MNALSFNQVSLNPVAQPDSQIWITSAELAKALGYARADAVNKIFERNSDEFTERMSLNVKMTLNGINNSLRQKAVRIFSLRGCYAIAFFAKTEVAKQFRRWVLDLIENEVEKLTGRTTTADERTGLRDAVNSIVSKKGLLYPDAYRLVHQRFNVEHIDELTLEQVGEATEYLHRLLLEIESSDNKAVTLPNNWQPLIMCALTCEVAWSEMYPVACELERNMANSMNQFFKTLSIAAKSAARSIGFTPSEIHTPWDKFNAKRNFVVLSEDYQGDYILRIGAHDTQIAKLPFNDR